MGASTLERLKESIKTLTREQQMELRTWWSDQDLVEPDKFTEDDFERRLSEIGIIRLPPLKDGNSACQNRVEINIQGESLSETVIRERR